MENPKMEQTELIKQNEQKRMIKKKEKAPEKMVTIESLCTIYVDDELHAPGTLLEVPESAAKDFCTPLSGSYNHSGNISTPNVKRYVTVRAKRVEGN